MLIIKYLYLIMDIDRLIIQFQLLIVENSLNFTFL